MPEIGKRHGPAVARELVGAVAAAAADLRFNGSEAMVEFAPQAQIQSFGDFQDGTVFLHRRTIYCAPLPTLDIARNVGTDDIVGRDLPC